MSQKSTDQIIMSIFKELLFNMKLKHNQIILNKKTSVNTLHQKNDKFSKKQNSNKISKSAKRYESFMNMNKMYELKMT